MTFTLNYIALILIALVAGLLLGLMASGRGKYKRLWRDEQLAHRRTIKERDARINGPVSSRASPVRAHGEGHDDLTRIRSISAQEAAILNEAGYRNYAQMSSMSDEQQATLEGRLGRAPGTIEHEEWMTQAKLLETGKVREHERRYIER